MVYENGVEVSRTLINTSSYAPAPRYVTVGTMVEEEPEDIQEPVTDNKDKEEDKKEKPNNGDNEEKEPKEHEADETKETSLDEIIDHDDQLERDIYWEPDWDEEGLEDE